MVPKLDRPTAASETISMSPSASHQPSLPPAVRNREKNRFVSWSCGLERRIERRCILAEEQPDAAISHGDDPDDPRRPSPEPGSARSVV